MNLYKTIGQHTHQVLPHQVVAGWLESYKRPNDKIKSLGEAGLLLPIKKGLYIAGPVFDTKPESFLIANHILGPSYVSTESALSYYGLIPERVYAVTSITTKSSREFDTPVGRFTYRQLPLPYYAFGLTRVELADEQFVMMASPEKAICDQIVTSKGVVFRSVSACRDYLLGNMRMDEKRVKELNKNEILSWIAEAPKSESLRMLVKTIEKL